MIILSLFLGTNQRSEDAMKKYSNKCTGIIPNFCIFGVEIEVFISRWEVRELGDSSKVVVALEYPT